MFSRTRNVGFFASLLSALSEMLTPARKRENAQSWQAWHHRDLAILRDEAAELDHSMSQENSSRSGTSATN